MSNRLEIYLLGGLQIRHNNQSVTQLVSRKAEALLAYLACKQQPHSREVLADFFWENRTQTQAAGNLRVVINSLRTTLKPFVSINRYTLAVNPQSELWVDALAFTQLLSDLRPHPLPNGELPALLVGQLEQALALYQGEFLTGFFLRQAPLFEEWARIERERLHILATQALQALANHYLTTHQYASGINTVERWLHFDLLNENAHRILMRLLVQEGHRAAALQHFERMVLLFQHELGQEPTAETERLYHQILDDTAVVTPQSPPLIDTSTPVPSPHNLEAALSPIIGREPELAQILTRLQLPACRLLTLVGIGGIGKTRLALEAARRFTTNVASATLFADGIFWVRLEHVETEALLLAAIAQAVHYSFQSSIAPTRQLLDFLRQRRLLLVLDNMEHLLDETPLLLQILQAAPGIKLLVTSRARLDFQGEWLVEVNGLPYPPTVESGDWESYPAAQLFMQCATAVDANFAPNPQRNEIIQICQMMEGLPLGIQLAASSVRAFSCNQLVRALQHNLDFLASTMRNLPLRHRSLRAIFEHSWLLLTPDEKDAFQRLAIFEGSFTAAAAGTVAQIAAPVLLGLIEKSLIHVRLGEVTTATEQIERRYRMHPVLHQYAAEKLAALPAAGTELAHRHALYYAQLVVNQAPLLHTAQAAQAIELLTSELENIRKSWQTAVTLHLLDTLQRYLPGLIQYYRLRGLFQEGQTLITLAVEELSAMPAGVGEFKSPIGSLLSHLLAYKAILLTERGYYEEAAAAATAAVTFAQASQDPRGEALSYLHWGMALHRQADYTTSDQKLAQALALAEQANLPQVNADAYFYQGRNRFYVGDYTGGQRYHEQAITRYRAQGDLVNELAAYNSLAMLYLFAGEYTKARVYYEQCLHDYRLIGNQPAIGLIYNNLGALATLLGNYAEARGYYEESLTIRRRVGGRQSEALILSNLAITWHQSNNQTKALDYCQAALQLSIALGERDTEAYARLCLGHVLAALERWSEANAAYQLALTLRRQAGQPTQALEPLAGLARVALARGEFDQAKAYIEEIVPHLGFQTYAGIVELIRIYLTCYQVLTTLRDPRAAAVLSMGYTILQERAAKISDEAMRHSYLQITVHAEVVRLCTQR